MNEWEKDWGPPPFLKIVSPMYGVFASFGFGTSTLSGALPDIWCVFHPPPRGRGGGGGGCLEYARMFIIAAAGIKKRLYNYGEEECDGGRPCEKGPRSGEEECDGGEEESRSPAVARRCVGIR